MKPVPPLLDRKYQRQSAFQAIHPKVYQKPDFFRRSVVYLCQLGVLLLLP